MYCSIIESSEFSCCSQSHRGYYLQVSISILLLDYGLLYFLIKPFLLDKWFALPLQVELNIMDTLPFSMHK